MTNTILILILSTLSLSLQLNITFNTDGNNYTIYNNGTMSNYFQYIPNIEKRCDCSSIDTYYIGYNDNNTLFYLSLNETDVNSFDLSTISVLLSNEDLIDMKQTLTKFNNNEFSLSIEHNCTSVSSEFDKWSLIRIGISPSINIDYLKYCHIGESHKNKGSVLSTIIIFICGALYVFLSTKAEILLVYSETKPEGEMSITHGVGIVVIGSAILLIMFFFAQIIFIQWIFAFLISGQFLLSTHLTIRSFYETSPLPKMLPILSKVVNKNKNIDICHILLFINSHIVLIIYFVTKHWLLNNFLCFCLGYTILSLYHFRSFRQCIWFLCITFLYDVFWVYISPLIFKGNVMVFAATSINLPIKLEMPIFLSPEHPLKTCLLLGLGDIVIPGFIIKFFKRFDFIKKTNVYYKMGIVIYCFALVSSGLVVFFFNSPQPVLFYMCPSLIAGAMIVAYKRGEVKDILYSDNIEDSMNFDDIDKGTKVPNKENETKSNIEIPSISTMIETEDNVLPQVDDINIDEDDSDEEDDDDE